MDEDVKRLLTIIKRAPSPFGKTDSELAQEYRNWFLGSRLNMKAAEQSFAPDAPPETCEHGNLPSKCPVEICSYSKHGGRR